LNAPTLPLAKIAKYWSREIQPPAPEGEILDGLLAAFWRGDLGTQEPDHLGPPDDRRIRLLRVIGDDPRHPELMFIREGDVAPPRVVNLPDGGAVVGIFTTVHLPASGMVGAAFDKAYSELASVQGDAFSGVTGPILFQTEITREAFAAYCAKVGQKLPRFWFANQRLARRASDVSKATARFEVAVNAGKRWNREEALANLKTVAPSLSQREFGKIWAAKAPPAWKRAGRRPEKALAPKVKPI
jgi:hypothetical protein